MTQITYSSEEEYGKLLRQLCRAEGKERKFPTMQKNIRSGRIEKILDALEKGQKTGDELMAIASITRSQLHDAIARAENRQKIYRKKDREKVLAYSLTPFDQKPAKKPVDRSRGGV